MTARFPLACNTVLFRDHPLRDALEAIAWAGFDGAELAFISGMVEHVSPEMGDSGLAEVRAMAADLGLRLFSIEVTPNAPDRGPERARRSSEEPTGGVRVASTR